MIQNFKRFYFISALASNLEFEKEIQKVHGLKTAISDTEPELFIKLTQLKWESFVSPWHNLEDLINTD